MTDEQTQNEPEFRVNYDPGVEEDAEGKGKPALLEVFKNGELLGFVEGEAASVLANGMNNMRNQIGQLQQQLEGVPAAAEQS